MNRRAVYFAVMAFIILLVFYNSSRSNLDEFEPTPLTKEEILTKFNKLDQTTAGKADSIKYLFFPVDYTGEKDSLFYTGKVKGDNYITEKYLIEKTDDNRLIYVLKDTWQDILLPPARFETYILDDFKWVKIN